MKRATLRLPERLYDDIQAEADARERSFSEFVRLLLREREQIELHGTRERESVHDRLDELERRIDDLEAGAGDASPALEPHTSTAETPSDVVEYVRENGPVSKADIVDAFEEVWRSQGIKPDSWWERHAREELADAGGTFTRNVGWSING